MYKANSTIVLPGRLLVQTIQSDGVDAMLGIQLSHNPSDTLMAVVIRTSDEENFPEGCTVMYDRLHSKDIELIGPDGTPQTYKVIQTADVSLILRE